MNYRELKNKFPKLLEDVREFTAGIHGFESRGKPIPFNCYLERREKFYRKLSNLMGRKLEIDPEAEYKGFMSWEDGSIHLNFDAINDESCQERAVLALTHLAIPQFLYFETKFGEEIKKEFENARKEGRMEEMINEFESNVLKGVCKAFELDGAKNIKGYKFGKVESEILEDLEEFKETNPGIEEGYSIYRGLQERVKKLQKEGWDFDETTHTAERILKASLLVAGRDENFDRNYRGLRDMEIEEIYALAGAKVFVGAPVEKILKLCKKIREECTSQEVVFKHILKDMEELKNDLYHKGFGKEAEKFSEFVEACSKSIKPTEVFKLDLIRSLNQRLALIEKRCKEARKRPPKIMFS